MLKKAKAEAGTRRDESTKDMSQSVLESSRQIWLAGLGAFSKAQAEGMKGCESLVKQGERLDAGSRPVGSAIRTGTFCVYLPDPRVPVDWRVS